MENVREKIICDTILYAKRQRTWFKRNPYIKWVSSHYEAEKLVKAFLAKRYS
jgi:tRNA A37 N6-isopentenylltransferase MiaA